MAAPEGNNYRLKFKTPEERAEVFYELILHLEGGYSRECFAPCDRKTIQNYINDYPKEFPADRVAEAEAVAMKMYEGVGMDGMNGKIEGFAASTYQFIMRNKFRQKGWNDRHEVDHTSGGKQIQLGLPQSQFIQPDDSKKEK